MTINKNYRLLLMAALVVLAVSLSASAGVTYVDYNLSHPQGDNGNTYNYGSTPYILPISGFETNAAPSITGTLANATGSWNLGSDHTATSIYGKVTNHDSSETGLGMTHDPESGQHEEWSNPGKNVPFHYGFVMLDLANLEANPDLLYFFLQIGSAQTHEWFTIWGSNPGDQFSGTLLMEGDGGSGSQTGFLSIPNWRNYQYIWVGAIRDPNSDPKHNQANILLDSEIAFNKYDNHNPVPEPGTLGMMGTGLVSLAVGFRKRFLN